MKENKGTIMVVISTIVFGILSKWLVGVPYMAWGYFDNIFIVSFLLWCFYTAVLYIAVKLESNKEI